MTILITGATGRIGRYLVTQLLGDGYPVRALTRNPEAAQLPETVDIRKGDLSDVATLHAAFSGIDALHLITFGGDDGADLTNGADIVQLAEASGIRRVSVLAGWAPTSIEEALGNSRLDWCRIEPVEIMYNTWDWADEIRTNNTVSTLATYPSALVHEADIAAVAACALTQDGHARQTYRVTGPESLTPAQRTAILSDVIGRPITHIQLTEVEERNRLAAHGLANDYVEFGIQLAINPPEGADRVLDTVPRITGRPGRTFAQWAQENATAW
ncbi:NAD-dependent epimerase/dehydratase family protein [Buchananella hordeovulneris]|uniref:NAD(P)H-binding protein n=1 Tax=Buchananella hordeovulneris TaxID=52770 RepID=UPI000F5E75E1|nr:NAD(P)H-binding protein [Buchananella hordeovulneris]RRD52747.1 NAD-dependent epimerase/dehydratase family protein [Buchananella hordeovulneris]